MDMWVDLEKAYKDAGLMTSEQILQMKKCKLGENPMNDELQLLEELRGLQKELEHIRDSIFDYSQNADSARRNLRVLLYKDECHGDDLIYIDPKDTKFYDMIDGRTYLPSEQLHEIADELIDLAKWVELRKINKDREFILCNRIATIKHELGIQ